MPSGAIPTVLRTAVTFSPFAQHKKVFLLLFVHKKKPSFLFPDRERISAIGRLPASPELYILTIIEI
jgi:hypothetical protein